MMLRAGSTDLPLVGSEQTAVSLETPFRRLTVEVNVEAPNEKAES